MALDQGTAPRYRETAQMSGAAAELHREIG
jgi:hypothetical protein